MDCFDDYHYIDSDEHNKDFEWFFKSFKSRKPEAVIMSRLSPEDLTAMIVKEDHENASGQS